MVFVMSISRSIFLCLGLTAISFSACAEGNIRLGGGLGDADIDLKEQFLFDDTEVGKNSKAYNFYAGYGFENNVFVDLAIESAASDVILINLSDNLSYFSLDFSVGYTFNFDKIYFEPAVGYSSWLVESEEGAFLNSGPEEKKEIDGNDLFGELTLGYRLSGSMGLSLTYKFMDADFGEYDLTSLNLNFVL